MKPLIFDFQEKRTEYAPEVIYKYDFQKSLNVVEVENGTIPFIDLDDKTIEMTTKTKAHRENDDHHSLLELQTKTEVRRERDDRPQHSIELMTKTYTKRESDDHRL